MPRTTEYPPSPCPFCGKLNELSTVVTREDAAPKPGDVSLCIGCGEVAVFGGDGIPRRPTDAEMDAIRASNSWPVVQRVRAAIYRAAAGD